MDLILYNVLYISIYKLTQNILICCVYLYFFSTIHCQVIGLTMFTSQPKVLDTIVYYQRSAANLYLILNYQNNFTKSPKVFQIQWIYNKNCHRFSALRYRLCIWKELTNFTNSMDDTDCRLDRQDDYIGVWVINTIKYAFKLHLHRTRRNQAINDMY